MRALAAAVLAAIAVVAAGAPAARAAPGPGQAPEYWFDSWRVPALWAGGARGQGVTIAEIDTGVNAALPELSGKILRGTDLGAGGNGHVDRDKDGFGHGTAMASIMVARPGVLNITGLAPDAKVLPIAVPLTGTTDAGQPDQLAQAITYAADHGAGVISMSLGGKRSPKVNSEPCPDDEQQAIFRAVRKGAVVVASVGNDGPTRNSVEEPGVCLGVLSVGAISRSGAVAKFSSREPYLTLVAPGVDIPSLGRIGPQAYRGNGTSQATALVAAAIALVRSRYPTLSADRVVARVLATLDDKRSTRSSSYGYGKLNAYRAVTAEVPADAPNPVYAGMMPFLRQAEAQATPSAPKPPAAVRPVRNTGTFRVGGVQRFTGAVQAATALAAAGLVALVLLLALGWRGHRARRRASASAAQPLGSIWLPPDPPY